MKIAFVGKGGSGKSTLTSLFITYLKQKNKGSVLAIDADLNMNLAGLLGANVSEQILLARPEVAESIRTYLKGTNSRIQDTSKFLPTTPPGFGSNLICTADDSALAPYSVQVSDRPLINLLTVGTYDSQGIGQTCYHSHLFVAENLLSHTITNQNFNVVCDMVAGTDAFAYSLHLQFDAIVLISEPTPESSEVCRQYLHLANESGVNSLVHLVGNKIEDQEDLEFIAKQVGKVPLTYVPTMSKLKKSRQLGQAIDESILNSALFESMQLIESKANNPAINSTSRMQMLHQLHIKLNGKKWVQQGYGDVANQIDPDFKLNEKVGVLV